MPLIRNITPALEMTQMMIKWILNKVLEGDKGSQIFTCNIPRGLMNMDPNIQYTSVIIKDATSAVKL